ncbi:MAG: BamA/TamA family outer membrane protein [Myxococcota bacterium]
MLLALASAFAASWNPDHSWRTLTTEHFRVTFHEGEERVADDMAEAAEEAWDLLTPEIGTTPKERIELVLVDWTDSANGYATIVPQNTIVIFVTAPQEDSTLGLYEDWNDAIVRHELTHILHISTVEGLPKLARLLMGTYVSTHQVSPGWIVEGYATFEETRMTNAGRGRHAGVDMIKRAAVLEGHFPPLGNMDGYQALPPGGNLRYLFGQDFIQFVADTRGADKWTEWVHTYGRGLPYLLPAKKVFGATFTRLHREWKAELERRYGAQKAAIEAEGLTPYEVVSPEGESCGEPAWSPDGQKLAYACSDPRRGYRIWLADAEGKDEEVVAKARFAKTIAWRADGRAFAYASSHVVGLYDAYDDVFLYDVEKKSTKALTNGQRARDPAFSPDGSRMVVVTNEAQVNQLAVLTVDGQLRPLTANVEPVQYGTPRFSPDGRQIAVSVWQDGTRDLWLYSADGQPRRRLTWDAAIDRDPVWSADGRWLFFTSDRGGKTDVHAVELATERLFRVTNVLTGAWGAMPHPDGTKMAFNVFTTRSTQVAITSLDPTTWKDLGLLPRWPGEPAPPLVDDGEVAPLPPPAPKEKKSEEFAFRWPVKKYNPLPTLFPPRFWVPSVYLTYTGETWGLLGAAATAGSDTLNHLGYNAYVTYRTDSAFVGGGGSVYVNRWRPVFVAGASTYVTPYGDVYVEIPPPDGGGATIPSAQSANERYWDHRVRGSLAVGYPLTERSSATVAWQGTLRQPLDPLPEGAYDAYLPTRGFFSSIAGGWRWGKSSAYALSISPENARSVALAAEWTPSVLGSWTYDDAGTPVPFDQIQATAEWREYVTNPWIANHVLATRFAGGATVGDRFRYGSFRLGGSFSEGGIAVVPDEWRMLRGFSPASDSGEWYWLGSGEYRFPIVNIDRGVGTFPLFVRNVSGAVFLDAGNAFDDAEGAALAQTLAGAGAEVRVYLIASYGYGVYTRLGYQFAAVGDGIPLGDPGGFYAWLGSSF